MNVQKLLAKKRLRKARHVRRTLRTNLDRPRLTVFRSNEQIYCQVIDDLAGKTLCAANSLDQELRDSSPGIKKSALAGRVGEAIAKKALELGIAKVRFDRGSHCYHGRVKALADGARKGGLEF